MWGEVVSRAVKGRKPHRKLAEFTPCCNERRWSALFNSLRFWDFFCNWLLTKVFIIIFFNLFRIACQGTQPYHAMCSNSNQPPLCWTVDWTWLPPSTSFLCHLFKGMYWCIWNRLSFSWLKNGPQYHQDCSALCVVQSLLCSLKNILKIIFFGWVDGKCCIDLLIDSFITTSSELL